MPTYHYRCSDCAHSFDFFQKFADDPLTVCPECGGAIRRVPQPVGIVFKGSGWYVTDSREKKTSPSTSTTTDGEKPAGEKPADTVATSTKEPSGKKAAPAAAEA